MIANLLTCFLSYRTYGSVTQPIFVYFSIPSILYSFLCAPCVLPAKIKDTFKKKLYNCIVRENHAFKNDIQEILIEFTKTVNNANSTQVESKQNSTYLLCHG